MSYYNLFFGCSSTWFIFHTYTAKRCCY